MSKKAEIYCCLGCPYFEHHNHGQVICDVNSTELNLYELDSIPEWCPLEDWEGENG